MKVVIPIAGKGTRLRPHTFTTPKPLLHVAGKPILGHMLDDVVRLGIKDVVLIVGPLREQIEEYVRENYGLNATYVEQKEPKGLGHAIYLAKDAVGDEPMLIVYGDTLYEGDIGKHLRTAHDGAIGTVHFDDPRAYGIVELDGDRVTKLVEKPAEKKPGEVIIGVNVFRNSARLFRAIEELMERDIRTKNEYQLTDAMQLMVEQGATLTAFPIKKWLDCGNPDTMLSTNKRLLELKGRVLAKGKKCTIIPPVHIPKSAKIENSTIGPNVSVAEGVTITNSTVKDSILHPGCVIEDSAIEKSLVGHHAVVRGVSGSVNIGDYSEITGAK